MLLQNAELSKHLKILYWREFMWISRKNFLYLENDIVNDEGETGRVSFASEHFLQILDVCPQNICDPKVGCIFSQLLAPGRGSQSSSDLPTTRSPASLAIESREMTPPFSPLDLWIFKILRAQNVAQSAPAFSFPRRSHSVLWILMPWPLCWVQDAYRQQDTAAYLASPRGSQIDTSELILPRGHQAFSHAPNLPAPTFPLCGRRHQYL